jgi:hypothetical protein
MSTHKSVSGATVNDVVERIKAKFPVVTANSKFIVGDAFRHLYQVKHLHAAIVALVLNKLYELDPTIGDAACEMRVLIVHWLRETYLTVSKSGDGDAARAYLEAHVKDKTDTQVRTVADARSTA